MTSQASYQVYSCCLPSPACAKLCVKLAFAPSSKDLTMSDLPSWKNSSPAKMWTSNSSHLHLHRGNATERAIIAFKNHFIAALCSAHNNFPVHLWDSLLRPKPPSSWNVLCISLVPVIHCDVTWFRLSVDLKQVDALVQFPFPPPPHSVLLSDLVCCTVVR